MLFKYMLWCIIMLAILLPIFLITNRTIAEETNSNNQIIGGKYSNYFYSDKLELNDIIFYITKKSNKSIDVLIPLGPNDFSIIKRCVKHVFMNVVDINNVYIATPNPSIITNTDWFQSHNNRLIIIDETSYIDFTYEDIKLFFKEHELMYSAGWYLQQFLKLYGDNIHGIKENFVCVDADVIFLKPTTFISNDKLLIYLRNIGISEQYKISCKYLLPNLVLGEKTAISDHMVFNGEILKKIRIDIENNHPDKPLWKTILLSAIYTNNYCGFSEYELFYAYAKSLNKVEERSLKYIATGRSNDTYNVDGFDIAVFHSSMAGDCIIKND